MHAMRPPCRTYVSFHSQSIGHGTRCDETFLCKKLNCCSLPVIQQIRDNQIAWLNITCPLLCMHSDLDVKQMMVFLTCSSSCCSPPQCISEFHSWNKAVLHTSCSTQHSFESLIIWTCIPTYILVHILLSHEIHLFMDETYFNLLLFLT